MAQMSVDYINPFLTAAVKVFQDVCQISTEVGKPYIKTNDFNEDTAVIIIGVTGEVKGQVQIGFSTQIGKKIASNMCMMDITELNEIAQSAISELGNMILGNAATLLYAKGIQVDITPPTICIGTMAISSTYAQTVCVPLKYEDQLIEINICLI